MGSKKTIHDLTGKVLGRLTVLRVSDKPGKTTSVDWIVECECGTVKAVAQCTLVANQIRSCGCLRRPHSIEEMDGRGGQATKKTYKKWAAMISRCKNPNNNSYHSYGGRGIEVCDRWRVYTNFLADMGEVPDGMTLERKDVNGSYNPSNCIWADWKAQYENRRGQKKYLVDGEWRMLKELAGMWNMSRSSTSKKAKNGQYQVKIIGENNG
jgi:hypothetical protein